MPERAAGSIDAASLTVQVPASVPLTGTGVHTKVNPDGAGHAAIALYHHFHDRDDVLRRMLPARSLKRPLPSQGD